MYLDHSDYSWSDFASNDELTDSQVRRMDFNELIECGLSSTSLTEELVRRVFDDVTEEKLPGIQSPAWYAVSDDVVATVFAAIEARDSELAEAAQ